MLGYITDGLFSLVLLLGGVLVHGGGVVDGGDAVSRLNKLLGNRETGVDGCGAGT